MSGPRTMGRGVGINDYVTSILMSSKAVNRTFGLLLAGYPGISEQKMVGYPAITERAMHRPMVKLAFSTGPVDSY